ncbi:MAG: 30S ribosomal protein S3 [archaeon]
MIERNFITQGIKKAELETYLRKELGKAGFTKLETVKTPLVTRIIVNVTRPGLAIGKGGTNIRSLTKEIEERFKIDNPQIEIKEIEVPELDAQAMADKISKLIERGFSWRSVAYRAIKDIMRAGAVGTELLLSGALGGKGSRKRKQRIAEGYMKKVGDQARLVDYGISPANAKFGIIGIKVKIVKPGTLFPDKFKIEEFLKKEEKVEEAEETQEKGKEEIEEKAEGKEEKKEKKEEAKEEKTEDKKEKNEKEKKKEKTNEKKEDTAVGKSGDAKEEKTVPEKSSSKKEEKAEEKREKEKPENKTEEKKEKKEIAEKAKEKGKEKK